ncbi:MAG: hypothetical protein WHS87_06445 [Anaerolineales bacterium]
MARRLRCCGFLLVLLCQFFLPLRAHAQEEIALLAPLSGETLRGQVLIQGKIPVLEGFAYAEIAFALATAPDTWFLIRRLEAPAEGTLAIWDTTQVRDDTYHLRLLVVFQDGRQQEIRVENLRLRNYIPTATPTPFPTPVPLQPVGQITFVPPTPTATFWPTPTPLAANPLRTSEDSLRHAWQIGAMGGILATLILIFGIRKRQL